MSQTPSTGHGFCGQCGVPMTGPVRFCPSCGQPQLPPPPSYSPPATSPSYGQLDGSRPPPRAGRRRLPLIAGGLVLLLVAGGSVAAVLLLGGSDSRLLDGGDLPDPVTSEPEEQWSWSPSGTALGGTAAGDVLVVGSDGDEGVTALDEDGEELWTADVGGYAYSLAQHDDVVFVSPPEAGGVVALSMEDGEELWSNDEGYVAASAGEGIVYSGYEGDLALLDATTGDELWSVSGVDAHTATDDAIYVLDGNELSRLAVDSGDEEWSVSTDFESDDETYVSLAATDDMVVLADEEAVAFDAGDGAELWSEGGGPDSLELGTYSSSRVYVQTADYSLDEPVNDVSVYDREGRVGDLDLDEGDYFSAVPFEVDGKPYAFSYSTGGIFDEDLEKVGQYDGQVSLVDGGVYTLDEDGELAYHELGAGSSEWRIETELVASEEYGASLVAFDGRVVVVGGDEVNSYQ